MILGGYSGAVNMPNLLNPYGWWEAQGYGLSGTTRAGMPWSKIVVAVNALVNSSTYGPYGGPLNFRGVQYGVDLSQLPAAPAFYRLTGDSGTSLLQAIQQVCQDAGCDFFV